MAPLTLVMVVLLFALPIIDWIAAVILVGIAMRVVNRALRERAFLAFMCALAQTAFFVVVVNTETGHPLWDANTGLVFMRIIFIVIGALPIVWLWLFATKKFRDPH
jgi:hypothetical protein